MPFNDFLSELARRSPQIVLAALAAKQGGFPALGAFQGGMQQAQEVQQAQQRQAQLDEERRQLQETQEARAQSAEQRAMQSADLERRQALLTAMINQDDGDPSALASFYGVPAEQAQPLVAPIVTAREKRKAREFVERLPKDERYRGHFESPQSIADLDNTTVLFQGKQVKIRDIRAMAEEVAVPPRPAQVKPDVPNTPEERVAAALARGDTAEVERLRQAAEIVSGARRRPEDEALTDINRQLAETRLESLRTRLGQGQGRPVLSSDANRIAEIDTSIADARTLETNMGKTGAASKVGAMLPNVVTEMTGWGTSAKQRQATIDRVKQVIGKALEGGVLRKEDEYKYVRIMPTISDPPKVAATKIRGLQAALIERRQITLDALADAGYDVSRFAAGQGGGVPNPFRH